MNDVERPRRPSIVSALFGWWASRELVTEYGFYPKGIGFFPLH